MELTRENDTSEYVKSFFLDYFIPHDFPHRSLIRNYNLVSSLLRYSAEEELENSEDETYYMFVEPLSMSLDQYINSRDQDNGIGYFDSLCVLLRLAMVLVHCYRYGIVHNDIKPDNIMMTSDIRNYEVRLIDFGESFVGFDVDSSFEIIRKGNAHTKCLLFFHFIHRAPELYRDYHDTMIIDASKADVWSLGVLTYSVLFSKRNHRVDDRCSV